jgi:Helix-turn-helix domain
VSEDRYQRSEDVTREPLFRTQGLKSMMIIDGPIDTGNPGVASSRLDVPTDLAPEPSETPPQSLGRRLGYSYDPIPSAIRGDRRLKPIDTLVLAILLSFAVWRRDSCWTTIGTIAARLPAQRPGRSGSTVACDRTVQRSILRLIAAGYIRRERIAKPDLDDPKNRTGYRYYFLFVPVQAPAVELTETPPVQPPSVELTPGVTKPVIQPTIIPKSGDRTLPPSPAREVTSKSPDFLVTQVRGEFRETEKTFNVANVNGSALARTGDGGKPPETGGTAPPASIQPRATEARPSAGGWSGRELAEKFLRKLRDRGMDLVVRTEAEGAEFIQQRPYTASVVPLQPDEIEELKRLRPDILAYLKGPASPAPKVTSKPAPAVPKSVQADVRKLIDQLPGNPDPAIEATVCRAISEALGDPNPESLATFLDLAGDVRRGGLAVGCLLDGFEAGCSRKAKNRGACFTNGLKASIRESRRIGDRQRAGGTP